MRFARILTTAVVGGGLLVGGYFAWQELAPGSSPSEMKISDQSGRTINVEVLGRTPKGVWVRRRSDGRKFVIQLSRLNEASRDEVLALALKPPGLQSLKQRLAFRRERLEEIDFKMRHPNMDRARLRGLLRKREKLSYKIERLRRKIDELGGDPGKKIRALKETPSSAVEALKKRGTDSNGDSDGTSDLLNDLKKFNEGRVRSK